MTTTPTTNALAAATGTWTIDAAHTTLGFSVRHAMVSKVRGGFTEFEGQLSLDGDHPERSTASLTIQAASIATKSADRDAHLASPDFLDVETYPTLTFASTGVRQSGPDDFVVTGDLTVRDVTKPVDIGFELVGVNSDPWGGTRIGFEAAPRFSRKEFGLTWNVAIEGGGILVGDTVKIELDVEGVKQAPEPPRHGGPAVHATGCPAGPVSRPARYAARPRRTATGRRERARPACAPPSGRRGRSSPPARPARRTGTRPSSRTSAAAWHPRPRRSPPVAARSRPGQGTRGHVDHLDVEPVEHRPHVLLGLRDRAVGAKR